MTDTVMNYMAKFSLDTTDLSKGITGAAISFDAITMAATTGLAAIQTAFDKTVGAAMDFADAMNDLSDVTGDTGENMQRLRAAGLAVGTDFSAIENTIRTFSIRLADSGTTGEELRAKLEEIGVQVKDSNGNYREASALYMEVNDRLGAMTDVYERNNFAMDVYGKAWANIADMITKADTAAKAFKETDVLSQEDLDKAEEFSIKLGQITDKLNMIGVNIGTAVIDDPRFQALMGNIDPDSILGMLLGVKAEEASSPAAAVKEQTAAVVELVDKFAGMSDLQMEYYSVQQELQAAQETYNSTLTGTSQAAMDTAAMNLQSVKNKYEELREEMYETAIQAQITANVIANPFYDAGAIENQAATDSGLISDMMQSSQSWGEASSSTERYAAVSAAFAMANSSSDTSNPYLNQLRALSSEATSSTVGMNVGWTNTSTASSMVERAMAALSGYQASIAAPVVNIVVSPDFSASAQEIANATAEATSRALARQAAQ